MKHKIISISMARKNLLEIARKTEDEGQAYLLTRDGEPCSALIPLEEYEAFLETSEVQADLDTLRNLKKALQDEKKGRLWIRDNNGCWLAARKNKKVA